MNTETTGQQTASKDNVLKQAVISISDGLIIVLAASTALYVIFENSGSIINYSFWIAIAGGIILGIGGYFSARSRMESLAARSNDEEERSKKEEAEKTIALFQKLDLGSNMQEQAIVEIEKDSEEWKSFLQKNKQDFEMPKKQEVPLTGLIIGISFIAGAMLGLIPYLLFPEVKEAFKVSLWINLPLLFITGLIKSKVNAEPLISGSVRLLLLGAAITAAAYLIARIFVNQVV